jgi:hypothetical protein
MPVSAQWMNSKPTRPTGLAAITIISKSGAVHRAHHARMTRCVDSHPAAIFMSRRRTVPWYSPKSRLSPHPFRAVCRLPITHSGATREWPIMEPPTRQPNALKQLALRILVAAQIHVQDLIPQQSTSPSPPRASPPPTPPPPPPPPPHTHTAKLIHSLPHRYEAIASVINGTTKSATGGCAALSDDLGEWADTPAGTIATHFCPGTTEQFSRACHTNGTWESFALVDTSTCTAPTACDVCNCYNCGGFNQRLCGAAVGLQTSTRGSEFFADCAHANLIVAPRDYPLNTTRIDLQGNTMLRSFDSDAFATASNVWRICKYITLLFLACASPLFCCRVLYPETSQFRRPHVCGKAAQSWP